MRKYNYITNNYELNVFIRKLVYDVHVVHAVTCRKSIVYYRLKYQDTVQYHDI